MITLENLENVPLRVRGSLVAIGNFDGVHRGHVHLLQRLRDFADSLGVPSLALSFDPPPAALLRPDAMPAPLTRIEQRLELMKAVGVTEVGVFKTASWLLELSAREFYERVILQQLAAKGMVEGPTFGFGRDRGGNVQLLEKWCGESGLAFEVVTPTEWNHQLVSSSRIRQALADGDVAEATTLLGRPHAIKGLVTHGAGRGAGIGVPTANLDLIDTVIPIDGVYAARARVDGIEKEYSVACNIGPNPTFGEQIRKVEAHLIGFEGDLYGRYVELAFVQRIRSTRRFDGLDDLLRQIHADIDEAGRIVSDRRVEQR